MSGLWSAVLLSLCDCLMRTWDTVNGVISTTSTGHQLHTFFTMHASPQCWQKQYTQGHMYRLLLQLGILAIHNPGVVCIMHAYIDLYMIVYTFSQELFI